MSHNASRWRVRRQQASEKHSIQYLDFTLRFAGQTATELDAVEQELINLQAGMKQAYEAQRFDDVIDYASVLCRPESGCLGVRGYRAELRHGLEIAVTAARLSHRLADEAVFHHSLAVLALNQGKMAVVKAEVQTSLEQFTQLQDTRGMARSQGLLATMYRLQGNYGQARQELERLLGHFADLDDKTSLAVTYNQLGRLAEAERDGESAGVYYQADLALEEEAGNERGIALARWGLGNAAYLQRELETAQIHYQAAWKKLEAIGDKQNLAGLLGQLANLERRLGNTAQAQKLFWQVIDISHNLGDVVVESMALFNLASLSRQLGDLPQAIEIMEAAVVLEEAAGLADLEQDRQALAQLYEELRDQQTDEGQTLAGSRGE